MGREGEGTTTHPRSRATCATDVCEGVEIANKSTLISPLLTGHYGELDSLVKHIGIAVVAVLIAIHIAIGFDSGNSPILIHDPAKTIQANEIVSAVEVECSRHYGKEIIQGVALNMSRAR